MFKKTKKVNNTENNNLNSKKDGNNFLKNKNFIFKIVAFFIILGAIIGILCGFLIPKTKEVTVRDIPTFQQYLAANPSVSEEDIQNQLILQTDTGSFITISNESLQNAEISPLAALSHRNVYLVYLPNSSIGKMEFMFSVYDNAFGPSAIQIGSTIIALQNTATIAYLSLHSHSDINKTLPYSDSYSILAQLSSIKHSNLDDTNIPGITQVSAIINKYKNTNIFNFLQYVYLNTGA